MAPRGYTCLAVAAVVRVVHQDTLFSVRVTVDLATELAVTDASLKPHAGTRLVVREDTHVFRDGLPNGRDVTTVRNLTGTHLVQHLLGVLTWTPKSDAGPVATPGPPVDGDPED